MDLDSTSKHKMSPSLFFAKICLLFAWQKRTEKIKKCGKSGQSIDDCGKLLGLLYTIITCAEVSIRDAVSAAPALRAASAGPPELPAPQCSTANTTGKFRKNYGLNTLGREGRAPQTRAQNKFPPSLSFPSFPFLLLKQKAVWLRKELYIYHNIPLADSRALGVASRLRMLTA